jgi:3-amino-5-hydroxybenzoate synthase
MKKCVFGRKLPAKRLKVGRSVMNKPALLGGSKAKGKAFPAWPHYDDLERDALNRVLESRNWWRTPGVEVSRFEEEFARYHQTEYGVAVTNGTHALEVVLAAVDIGPGDEVIIPDFTFVATAGAVLSVGAMPVMVDVLPTTYCIDSALVEEAVTSRTKAIITVHMGGHPADLDQLGHIASKMNLLLIEDSAHAHGSEWQGKKIGGFGLAGTFSFQSSKLLTSGEGGIIITNDETFERQVRSIHDCGRMPGEWFYSHYIYGSNFRMTEWQGALLRTQLSRLEAQTAKRHRNARLLDSLLSSIEGITPQSLDERCTRNGHYAYIFHYNPEAFNTLPIDTFIQAVIAEGIPNQASYPPIHDLDLFKRGALKKKLQSRITDEYRDMLQRPFPVSHTAAWETVWIPQFALLGDEEDMEEIARAISKIQEHSQMLV